MKRSLWIIYILLLCVGVPYLFIVPAMSGYPDEHKGTRTKYLFSFVRDALKYYYREYGTLPSGSAESVITALKGRNPRNIIFLELLPPKKRFYFWTTEPAKQRPDGALIDEWGRPVVWSFDSNGFPISIRSLGKDAQPDAGEDDIVMNLTPQ